MVYISGTAVDMCMLYICMFPIWYESIRTPFTASRYALRSLCSLEPSACGQNVKQQSWNKIDGKTFKVQRCDTSLQICLTYKSAFKLLCVCNTDNVGSDTWVYSHIVCWNWSLPPQKQHLWSHQLCQAFEEPYITKMTAINHLCSNP